MKSTKIILEYAMAANQSKCHTVAHILDVSVVARNAEEMKMYPQS